MSRGHSIWFLRRGEVRWRPGQKASLAPLCSNLRSFRSKSTVLKKVLVTLLGLFGTPGSHSAPPAVIQHVGNCVPLPPSLRSCIYVIGISPRNPQKAIRLKPTDFPVSLMLCLLFGPTDSTIWLSFKWIMPWYIFWFCINVVKTK